MSWFSSSRTELSVTRTFLQRTFSLNSDCTKKMYVTSCQQSWKWLGVLIRSFINLIRPSFKKKQVFGQCYPWITHCICHIYSDRLKNTTHAMRLLVCELSALVGEALALAGDAFDMLIDDSGESLSSITVVLRSLVMFVRQEVFFFWTTENSAFSIRIVRLLRSHKFWLCKNYLIFCQYSLSRLKS